MSRALIAGLLTAALAAGPAFAASDAGFMKKALEGDNSEVQLGRLAAERGASPGVRDFGEMLARDHAAARQEAVQLAHRLGVPATKAMAPEAQAEERRLRRLSGPAFDQEFTRYMVEDHRKDIADFERQTRSGGPQTRSLALRTLPTLRHHLEVARHLHGA